MCKIYQHGLLHLSTFLSHHKKMEYSFYKQKGKYSKTKKILIEDAEGNNFLSSYSDEFIYNYYSEIMTSCWVQ